MWDIHGAEEEAWSRILEMNLWNNVFRNWVTKLVDGIRKKTDLNWCRKKFEKCVGMVKECRLS